MKAAHAKQAAIKKNSKIGREKFAQLEREAKRKREKRLQKTVTARQFR